MNIIDFVSMISIAAVVKSAVILILIIYILFAFIMVRQISLMARVVEVPIAFLLRLVVFIHFILSLLILVLAFTIL